MENDVQAARKRREEQARWRAQQKQRSITYIDDDGCEVTATAGGHIFYNAADWY